MDNQIEIRPNTRRNKFLSKIRKLPEWIEVIMDGMDIIEIIEFVVKLWP